MAKKIRQKKETPAKKDLKKIKENLEKTGEAVGDLFKGIFNGVGKILDVVQEMERKGEKVRLYKKELKGFTKSGKEFRGESGWRIKTGLLEPEEKREEGK